MTPTRETDQSPIKDTTENKTHIEEKNEEVREEEENQNLPTILPSVINLKDYIDYSDPTIDEEINCYRLKDLRICNEDSHKKGKDCPKQKTISKL